MSNLANADANDAEPARDAPLTPNAAPQQVRGYLSMVSRV